MSKTTRTGLIASPSKKIYRRKQVPTVQLQAVARPAPFVLKPFAGLYNPYPFGCSLLCNHPTNNETKELLKKAKDSWATEGKNLLLSEEMEAIRASLEQLQPIENEEQKPNFKGFESVPEELFRRYTETDSRPLTPAPTLVSAATRASGSRRCFTPDPQSTNQLREKTLLILDLRRSHSQETLSWHGSSSLHEPPIIRIQRVATRVGSFEESSPKIKSASHLLTHPSRAATPQPQKTLKKPKVKEAEEPPPVEKEEEEKAEEEEEQPEADDDFIKRRGKKKRKKREGSIGPPPFEAAGDPETQVAAIGTDSHNTSARPSLVVMTSEELQETVERVKTPRPSKCWDIDSFLDIEILKQLRRDLNEEVVDNEFNQKRRTALEEALKTLPKEKHQSEAVTKIQNELKLPPVNTELWLSLPRVFTRSSARFELPLDSRTLETMSPMTYIQNHVIISSPRKLLYNCVFNKFKMDDLESDRKLEGKEVQNALNLMMGRPMTLKQEEYFHNLIGWRDNDVFDFKTFCGLCALCERLLAPEYCVQLPDRTSDPCHEIETADFEALTRKLHGKKVDPNLVEILQGIKNR